MKTTTSGTGEYEVAWQEFDRNDRIVTKRKAFKTEEGRAKFIERISYKASFHGIYGRATRAAIGKHTLSHQEGGTP